MAGKIKLFNPKTGKEEEKAIINTLKSGFWASGSGSGLVSKFEEKFCRYLGAKRCVALSSGTAALHLALSLLDIKNKQVILPSLSFVSTAHAVIYNGGIPIFVDVDPKTLCIDINQIKKSISNKTKAVLPVHFGGMPCNLDELRKLCKKYSLKLIEDAAHAAGSTYKKRKIGSHGDFVCFSFHPVKNLAMPTGGAIVFNGKNSRNFCKIIKSRRWCGISNRKGAKYDVNELGWNYYMNEFSAAIGLKQLKKLDKMNKRRKHIAGQYNKEIQLMNKMPFDPDCSYHLFWIQVKNRDKFRDIMNKNGIETGIHYFPIHKMSYYNSKKSLNTTEKVAKRIVTLPIHPNLSDNQVNKIIKVTNKFSKEI